MNEQEPPTRDTSAAAARVAFISYASADRAVAESLTAYLEQRGLNCWMAPRDVPAGAQYADAIVRAISEARALVLVLSKESIGSSHVGREVERASSKKKQIIAVRLDGAALTPALEYFLSESQWVDVAADGREAAFAKLAGALANEGTPKAGVPAGSAAAKATGTRRWSRLALAAIAGIAILAAAVVLVLHHGRPGAPVIAASSTAAASDKSIAVLPFVDMSQAHDQEYFADGMSEQILDLLAKIPALKVIARTSSFQFKGKAEDVRTVGQTLGVATVLEGSVRKAGDRLRITAQLIRAADGSHLWSETYDRQVNDIFRTQDEIAGAVVSALKVSLLGAPERRAAPTSNTEAYTMFLQGLAYSQRYTSADSDQATHFFRRAVELDPNFAQAWAALANEEGGLMVFGAGESGGSGDFAGVGQRMTSAANRALAIDPNLPDAHVALANMVFLDHDYPAAEREIQAALRLEPDNANALGISIYLAIAACHFDDAERNARRLIERDPLAIDPYRGLGTALWFDGRLEEAATAFRQAIALHPDAESLHFRLVQVLLSAGRAPEALTEISAEHSERWRMAGEVMVFDALGRRAEADKRLAALEANVGGWQYQLAQAYAHRHDRERAFKWLQIANRNRDPGLFNYLKCDPTLSELRSDQRYQTLLAQLNLPP